MRYRYPQWRLSNIIIALALCAVCLPLFSFLSHILEGTLGADDTKRVFCGTLPGLFAISWVFATYPEIETTHIGITLHYAFGIARLIEWNRIIQVEGYRTRTRIEFSSASRNRVVEVKYWRNANSWLPRGKYGYFTIWSSIQGHEGLLNEIRVHVPSSFASNC